MSYERKLEPWITTMDKNGNTVKQIPNRLSLQRPFIYMNSSMIDGPSPFNVHMAEKAMLAKEDEELASLQEIQKHYLDGLSREIQERLDIIYRTSKELHREEKHANELISALQYERSLNDEVKT